jgi:thioredoxin-dependent peroxiredoxin
MKPGFTHVIVTAGTANGGAPDDEENPEMKDSRRAALRTVPYLFLAVALLAMAYPAIHAPAIQADDQAVPTVGSMAPDFTLNSQEGTPISLHSFRGKWVVLYFYPKDQTPGCTIEAHGFQRDQAKYDAINAVIVGVSVDTVESHKEWCAKDGMAFKLLSDANKQVVALYGSTMTIPQAPQLGMVAARNTFLIDPSGKIVKEFIKVNPTGHSEEVLAALNDLQKDSK